MKLIRLVFGLLVVASLVATGCRAGCQERFAASEAVAIDTPCTDSCPEPLVCARKYNFAHVEVDAGSCVLPCSSSDDCPSGFGCMARTHRSVPSSCEKLPSMDELLREGCAACTGDADVMLQACRDLVEDNARRERRDSGSQPSAEALAQLRKAATGIVVSGSQVSALKTALERFETVLEPGEKLADFKVTSYRRGPNWVVLFGPADPNVAGGGVEYTVDGSGEHILETVGGP